MQHASIKCHAFDGDGNSDRKKEFQNCQMMQVNMADRSGRSTLPGQHQITIQDDKMLHFHLDAMA